MATTVFSLAPVLGILLGVGALLAFSRRRRSVGTALASSAVLLGLAAFVI